MTSATHKLLLGRLEVAGLPIPTRIISADMVERGKPDPEPYLRGAALLGLAPENCVVVEDAPSGVGAGPQGGLPRAGCAWDARVSRSLRTRRGLCQSLVEVRVRSTGDGLSISLPETTVLGADSGALFSERGLVTAP